jgi:hypothetical protein
MNHVKVKIYQNMGIVEERDVPCNLIGYPFKIESARLIEQAFGKEDGLFLEIKRFSEDGVRYYGLVGNKIHKEFMLEFEVKKVNELVGKDIIGFIHKNKNDLHGLSVL